MQVEDRSIDASSGVNSAKTADNITKLFILSETSILREGIVIALSQQRTVAVVGSSDFSIPPRRITAADPDALLLDITVSKDLRFTRTLRALMPEVKIVALGVAEAEADMIACAEAGVAGFISSNGSLDDIVEAIHSAVRGELVCSPRTAGMLFRLLGSRIAARASVGDDEALTSREREIVVLMGEGLPNKQIARRLGIQNATVKNHVHSILGKLGVSRRAEVAAQLFQSGWSTSSPLPRANGSSAQQRRA